jgi:hypothetical protein
VVDGRVEQDSQGYAKGCGPSARQSGADDLDLGSGLRNRSGLAHCQLVRRDNHNRVGTVISTHSEAGILVMALAWR